MGEGRKGEEFDTVVLLQQITPVLNFDFCFESRVDRTGLELDAEWPVFMYTFKLRMYIKAGLYLRLGKDKVNTNKRDLGLLNYRAVKTKLKLALRLPYSCFEIPGLS